MLDYDGTLAPFNPDRSHAFPYPEVPPLLREIMDKGTQVVLVTGRPSRELVLLCGLYPHPEIWGSHGLERLTSEGEYSVKPIDPAQESALLATAADLRALGLEPNMEMKPGGIAVHWRGLDQSEAEKIQKQVVRLWEPLVTAHSLKLLEFDGGIELRVTGTDKGYAVNSILKQHGENAAVAYLGDDQTDEDAFLALKNRGLTILVRPQFRPTTADLWLKPPEELTEFLRQWLLTCGGEA
jgi:trehalose-phosphatase